MSKKILIVEDETMISTMYKMKLEQDGHEVVTADNGVDGISVAAKENFDLILLDVIMPQLDGFAVLGELRSKAATKETPIILLTNLGTEEDKKKGAELGANGYLIKSSLTPYQVAEEVKKFLA